jgi:hypothetical protein
LQVAARAEGLFARPGQQNSADRAVAFRLVEPGRYALRHALVQGIAALLAVDRDDQHRSAPFQLHSPCHVRRPWPVCPILASGFHINDFNSSSMSTDPTTQGFKNAGTGENSVNTTEIAAFAPDNR